MRKMSSLTPVLLVTLAILLAGCDPAKILRIKAGNKTNLSVTVYTNNKLIPSCEKEYNCKLIIHVTYKVTTIKTFYYGIRKLPNESIAYLSANIDSIVIINSSGKLSVSTKPDIQAYLKKNRSGYLGSILTIEAK